MLRYRAAFSLVELIISVVLLGIIVTFLYSTVSTLQQTNKIFSENERNLNKKEKVIELLYDDLFGANDLQLSGFKYSLASMQTTNSIYNIANPYVTWLVSKENNTLLRFESIKKFSNINSQNNYYYHISKVAENCEIFKIYQSKKKEHILIHIQLKGEEPIIYEFAKPLFIQKNHTKKKKAKVTAVQSPLIKAE
jgi:prepilin-type N-terminal cleavage/methylation domain-containing protein